MTTQTERVSDEKLQAMLAGCEGVTPGPWQVKYVGDGRMAFAIADSDGVSLLTIVEEDHADFAAVYSDGDAAHLVDCDPDTIRSLVSELLALREAVNGDSPRTDDIAASSVLYQCADCLRAQADYSCHRREDVFVIGHEVICRDCADAGHAGEQRRACPDIPAKLKRQRMAIATAMTGGSNV